MEPQFGRTGLWPHGTNNSLSFDYNRVIRPNLLFEGRFGWLQREWKQDAIDQDSATTTSIGVPGVNDACESCGGLTGFRIGGPVGAFDIGNNDHAHQVDNYGGYNYVGIVTWTKGGHSIKFGADINSTWRDRRDTSSQGNIGCFNGGLCDGNGFAAIVDGFSGCRWFRIVHGVVSTGSREHILPCDLRPKPAACEAEPSSLLFPGHVACDAQADFKSRTAL